MISEERFADLVPTIAEHAGGSLAVIAGLNLVNDPDAVMTQPADDLAQIEDDAGNMKTDWQQLDEFRNQLVNDALLDEATAQVVDGALNQIIDHLLAIETGVEEHTALAEAGDELAQSERSGDLAIELDELVDDAGAIQDDIRSLLDSLPDVVDPDPSDPRVSPDWPVAPEDLSAVRPQRRRNSTAMELQRYPTRPLRGQNAASRREHSERSG